MEILWKSCGNPVENFSQTVENFFTKKVFHRKMSFPQGIPKSFPQSVENFYLNVVNIEYILMYNYVKLWKSFSLITP